jgi:hypothetical protein
MHVYTYSEARQKLAIVLDQAENSPLHMDKPVS